MHRVSQLSGTPSDVAPEDDWKEELACRGRAGLPFKLLPLSPHFSNGSVGVRYMLDGRQGRPERTYGTR